MEDGISQVLQGQISAAQTKLKYVRLGVMFNGITAPIPDLESELVYLIDKWEGELASHVAKMRVAK